MPERHEYRYVGRAYRTRWMPVPESGDVPLPRGRTDLRLGDRYQLEFRGGDRPRSLAVNVQWAGGSRDHTRSDQSG